MFIIFLKLYSYYNIGYIPEISPFFLVSSGLFIQTFFLKLCKTFFICIFVYVIYKIYIWNPKISYQTINYFLLLNQLSSNRVGFPIIIFFTNFSIWYFWCYIIFQRNSWNVKYIGRCFIFLTINSDTWEWAILSNDFRWKN